jgi:hypothetical protein
MKATLLLISLLFNVAFSYAQISKSDILVQTIEKKIELNLWDDVLLLATDLITEDYSTGYGYYYSAVAFHKLGNPDNGKKYIEKAKSLANANLLQRIEQFEKNTTLQNELQTILIKAKEHDLSGNHNLAAEAWLKAWQLDKQSFEFALNSAANYIKLKEYEKALELLNQPVVIQFQPAKDLVGRINNTPEMTALNGYRNAIADGDKMLNEKSFEQARKAYMLALKHKHTDAYASLKKKEAEEELMYENAFKEKNPSKMEQFIGIYPDSKKMNLAMDFVLTNYLSVAKSSIIQKNHDEANQYLTKIGGYTSYDLWSNYSNEYYELIELEAKSLTTGTKSQRKKYIDDAIDYYKELNLATGKNYKSKISQLQWLEKEWNRDTYGYVIFKTGEELNDIGIEFGNIPNEGVGFSFTYVGAKQLFWDATEEKRFTTNLTYTRSYINFNLTRKIIYPLSAYAGAGYSYFTPVWHDYSTTDMGFIPSGIDPVHTASLEVGFLLRLKPFIASIGASFPFLNDEQKTVLGIDSDSKMDINFGLGFSF